MNEEKAISMNMPYVSVQKILEIVNKSIDEYERMYKNGKSSHEKKLGLRGALIAKKIKNDIIQSLKRDSRLFD